MNNSKPRTQQQHITPALHLRHFIDNDGKVWTYDNKNEKVWPSLPEETGKERNFYSVQNDAGVYNDTLEDWLADVESKAAPIYDRLLDGQIPQDQERADFTTFLASMYARTKAARRVKAEIMGVTLQARVQRSIATREGFEKMMWETNPNFFDLSPERQSEIYEGCRKPENFTMEVDQQAAIDCMLISDKLQTMFFDMGWSVITCHEQFFITSDNPVTRVNPPVSKVVSFDDKNVIVSFPLSPTRCLFLRWREPDQERVSRMNRQGGLWLNRTRAHFAEQYLYCHEKNEIIRRLGQKYKEPGEKIKFRNIGQVSPVVMKRKLSSDAN